MRPRDFASRLLVQTMLHFGAKHAGNPDRELVFLQITDFGDVDILFVRSCCGMRAM